MTKMTIAIRVVDLKRDGDELTRFLFENLTSQSDASRFDWLYLQNPHGQARAWMAVDTLGRTIGVASAFPRLLWVAGKPERAWVLGDFCFSREYRSLGPALQLQRVSLASLTGDTSGICYDFPSQSMMAIYRRLRVPVLGTQVRYVKLLRVDEKVQHFIPQNYFARGLTWVGNCALRYQHLPQSTPHDITFSQHEDAFGSEFNEINGHAAGVHTVQVLRTADYLNWRYKRHPMKRYCAVVARRQSEVLGYGIAEIDASHAILADLCAKEEPEVVPGIVGHLERVLREMKVCSISAPLLKDCHLIPYLRRFGFYPRETAPVVFYADSNGQTSPFIRDVKNWLLVHGDRES